MGRRYHMEELSRERLKKILSSDEKYISNNQCENLDFNLETVPINCPLAIVYSNKFSFYEVDTEDGRPVFLDYTLKNLPYRLNNYISKKAIEFLMNSTSEEIKKWCDMGNIYNILIKEIKRFVWLEHESDYHVVAMYITYTYFFDCFAETPILVIWGAKDSGKSQLLKVISKFGYRAVMADDISGPSLSRIIESNKGVFCIDEAENIITSDLPKWEDIRSMLKGSTSKGSQTLRVDKQTMKVSTYSKFSPKVLATTESPEEILGSRCLVLILSRNLDKKEYGKPEINIPNENEIRDKLTVLRLLYWKEIWGGKDPEYLNTYESRDKDLARPLLRIANYFDFLRNNYLYILHQRLDELMKRYSDMPTANDLILLLTVLANEYGNINEEEKVSTGDITEKLNELKFGERLESMTKYRPTDIFNKIHVGRLMSSLSFKQAKPEKKATSKKDSSRAWLITKPQIIRKCVALKIPYEQWFTEEEVTDALNMKMLSYEVPEPEKELGERPKIDLELTPEEQAIIEASKKKEEKQDEDEFL